MAPVTELWGPLASINLLFLLAPATTAVTARWWLARHVSSEPARLPGGAAVGFGPTMATHLGGHLNFAVLTLVPVLLRLAEDVVWRSPGRRRPALLLGVSAAAQALLSEEVLLLVAAGVAAVAVAGLVVSPRETAGLVRGAGRGLALAGGVAVVLLAVPVAVQLLGPTGPAERTPPAGRPTPPSPTTSASRTRALMRSMPPSTRWPLRRTASRRRWPADTWPAARTPTGWRCSTCPAPG